MEHLYKVDHLAALPQLDQDLCLSYVGLLVSLQILCCIQDTSFLLQLSHTEDTAEGPIGNLMILFILKKEV